MRRIRKFARRRKFARHSELTSNSGLLFGERGRKFKGRRRDMSQYEHQRTLSLNPAVNVSMQIQNECSVRGESLSGVELRTPRLFGFSSPPGIFGGECDPSLCWGLDTVLIEACERLHRLHDCCLASHGRRRASSFEFLWETAAIRVAAWVRPPRPSFAARGWARAFPREQTIARHG